MSALGDFKVLELAENVSGEYCGKLLSDFGAEIIKIERPGCGSPTRKFSPFSGEKNIETSGLFAYLNTGKHSVELDLSTKAGKQTLNQLLGCVDVVIDDHKVDWLKSLGLDCESITKSHPSLVVCSISNFGLEPPEDRIHSEDINVFHSSGWGYHTPTGCDPQQPPLNGAGRFLPSYEAALEAALCISASLFERIESATGQFIEISKQEVLASRLDYVLAQMVNGDMNIGTERSALDLSGPAGIFPCKDGFIYIWLSSPAHWQGLSQLIEDNNWMEAFPDNWLERECTPQRVAECRNQLAKWLLTQNKHQVAEQAQQRGVTLVPVNNAEDLLNSPQFQFRRYFSEIDHPRLGTVLYPTVPYHLSATPAKATAPAPLLGQHNKIVLGDNVSAQSGGEQ